MGKIKDSYISYMWGDWTDLQNKTKQSRRMQTLLKN
jgi:hypothetical protein